MYMTSLVCNCNAKAQYIMQWEKHVICFHCTEVSSFLQCNYLLYAHQNELLHCKATANATISLYHTNATSKCNNFHSVISEQVSDRACSSIVHYRRLSIAIISIQHEYD